MRSIKLVTTVTLWVELLGTRLPDRFPAAKTSFHGEA